MSNGNFDWEKNNRMRRLARQGFEPAEEGTGPVDVTPTRKEDRVYGISRAAMIANRADRKKLSEDKELLRKWIAAGDVSSIEIDKLRRRIRALEGRLAPEKPKNQKSSKSRNKKRKKKKAKQ